MMFRGLGMNFLKFILGLFYINMFFLWFYFFFSFVLKDIKGKLDECLLNFEKMFYKFRDCEWNCIFICI